MITTIDYDSGRPRMKCIGSALLLIVVSFSAHADGLSDGIGTCLNMQNDDAKLNCMSAVTRSAEKQKNTIGTGPAVPIDFTDFLLDREKMLGKNVIISGQVWNSADMYFLDSEDFGSHPIDVDTTSLTRDQRKALLTECNPSCGRTVVTGTVIQGVFGIALKATNVSVQ